MAETLRLRVVLDLAAKALRPLQQIAAGSGKAARSLKEARDRLKQLQDQQAAVGNVQKQAAEFARLNNLLKVKTSLLAGLRASGTATVAQLAREEGAVRKLSAALKHQRAAAGKARAALNAMGVSGNLGTAQSRLRADIDATTASIDKQRSHLQRLAEIRAKGGRAALQTAAAVGAGYGMRHAGMAMVGGLQRPMAEGRHYSTEVLRINALGLGDQAAADAVKFGKSMQTYGTSMVDNLGLMRDAITVFSDVHHAELVAPTLAKMKFANEAVFGAEDGAENEAKFMDMLKVIELRGGLASQEAFAGQANIVQRVLTATGGRVGPAEWLNMIKTGGVAAKGLTDEAFYYQMEPLVQEMGGNRVGTAMMSAYQNVYQGKTTKRAAGVLQDLGLIADPSKVKHDKVGQISQLGVGALKGSEIFRHNQFEWMEKVMLPALAAKGITERQQVLDTIGGMFSNRTASGLFAQMYLQRDQIHKNAGLNSRADGIDQLYTKAKETPAGHEIELRKKLQDGYQEFSTAVMPVYIDALKVATSAAKGLVGFMREFPVLTKVAGVGLGAVAIGLTALGALMIPLALVAGKALLLRFLFARLGVGALAMGAASKVAGAGMAVLRMGGGALLGALNLLRGGAAMLLGGLRVLAVFLVANPIFAAFALLAGAAYMVWRNWDGIKGGLLAIWSELSAGVSAWWANTAAGAAALWQDLVGLKDRFMTAGSDLMAGLMDGISARMGEVRDKVVGVASMIAEWFRETLGIASPSRVFIQYGGWISEGAALGIEGGQGMVRKAAAGVATAAALAAPMAVSAAGLTVDARAPLSAAPPAAQVIGGSTYNISITASPGMDAQALARAVTAELDRRERAKRAGSRSSLAEINGD